MFGCCFESEILKLDSRGHIWPRYIERMSQERGLRAAIAAHHDLVELYPQRGDLGSHVTLEKAVDWLVELAVERG